MTRRRMPRRGPGGRFLKRDFSYMHAQRDKTASTPSGASSKPPLPAPKPAVKDERPACFGNCYEGSSACDACTSYNSCRRATA